MRTTRIITVLVLSLVGAIGAVACVQVPDNSEDPPDDTSASEVPATAADALEERDTLDLEEPIDEAVQRLGFESPWPGPGTVLPGGYDPGGPGSGWAGGWANDPQYAAYVKPRNPDPYREADRFSVSLSGVSGLGPRNSYFEDAYSWVRP